MNLVFRTVLIKSNRLGIALSMMLMLVLSACQTTNPDTSPIIEPKAVYSGYFIWDSERAFGAMAVQCISLRFETEEVLEDGHIRLTGVSRYVTGVDREINFVDAEILIDPNAKTFSMWERNATSDSFVSDGKFVGYFQPDMLFMKAVWQSDSNSESGQMFLRKGADAPCNIAADA